MLSRDVPVRYATPAAASAAGDVFYIAGLATLGPSSRHRGPLGAERDIRVPQGAWLWPTASPDGLRLALGRWEGARRTLWTLTLDTGALTKVTYLDDTIGSRWMPDGKRILFAQFLIDPDERATSVWSVLTDGEGIEPIPAQWDAYPTGVSADGRGLPTAPISPIRPRTTSCQWRSAMRPRSPSCGLRHLRRRGCRHRHPRSMARVSDACVRHRRDARRTTHGSDRIRASLDPWRRSDSLESRRGHVVFPRRDTVAAIDIGPRGPVLTSRRALF